MQGIASYSFSSTQKLTSNWEDEEEEDEIRHRGHSEKLKQE